MKQKLAKRAALLKLNNDDCKIIINKASEKSIFTTKAGIFDYEGELCVSIPDEHIIIPVTDITKIEMPATRFRPDAKFMMEVEWND